MRQSLFHPWRRMRDLGPSWRLEWTSGLAVDEYGFTDHDGQTIYLRAGMSYEERRCTIAHEVEHALRGPVSEDRELAEELLIDRRVSRLLLPSMRDLCDALTFHSAQLERAASDLAVDPLTLEVRLSSMWQRERDYYERRMADVLLDSGC